MEPAADFAVEVATEDDTVVVRVLGDVDHAHEAELEAVMDHVIARAGGSIDLVVDLTDVAYCDSGGLRVLLGASRRASAGGGLLRLRGVAGQPSRALELTGLDRVLGT